MLTSDKKILFYNAIPMPHSIMLHKALLESGYEVYFWYYKDLTSLYPWKNLARNVDYYIYGREGNNLKKLIKQTLKSDLVIITGWHTEIHVLLAFFCFFNKIKYGYWLDVGEIPKSGLKLAIKQVLLKLSNFLLVTSPEGIRRISKWGKISESKFREFPYLSIEDNKMEMVEINKQRALDIISGDKIRVLISNRFEKRKGYNCVLNALKYLKIDGIDKFKFTIIGSGSEFEYYNKAFKELDLQIEFKFWVEYDEYLRLLKESDLLIHASIHEPFGIPPVDAMALGKLVIVSDGVMSTFDRIVDCENGMLFSADDSVNLFEVLKKISYDPNLVYKLGKKAYIDSRAYGINLNLDVINELVNI